MILTNNGIGINNKLWTFGAVTKTEGRRRVIIPNQTEVRLFETATQETIRHLSDKSPEEAYQELFDAYFKNKVIVRKELSVGPTLPNFLKNRDPVGFKIESERLNLYLIPFDIWSDLVRIVEMKNLKHLKLEFRGETQGVLDKPEIKNCKTLALHVYNPFQSLPINELVDLRNEHLEVQYALFTTDNIETLIRSWIETRRDIGTSFGLGRETYEDVAEIFQYFVENSGAVPSKHSVISDGIVIDGVTFAIGNNQDLFMFVSENTTETNERSISESSWFFKTTVFFLI